MKQPLTRRGFLAATASAIGVAVFSRRGHAAAAQPAPDADLPYMARLRVKHPTKVRILQMTDLHFFAGEKVFHDMVNRRTMETMQALVKLTKPDLVMATGDLWPEDRDGMGEQRMRFAIQQFEGLGVPWAFTWGNHDKLPDYAVGHDAFTKAKNSLYRGATTNGNYAIDFVHAHGKVLSQILCINSDEDGILGPQQQWLKSTGEELKKRGEGVTPRLAFFHIPLKQYDEMWRKGIAAGVKGEEVCLEKEDGSTLPILKSLNVRACFVGHDHSNDYAGVIDGVELVYGRATGAGGYGADVVHKGGKLITLNAKTGKYSWVTVLPDGTKWTPKPGEQIDKVERKK